LLDICLSQHSVDLSIIGCRKYQYKPQAPSTSTTVSVDRNPILDEGIDPMRETISHLWKSTLCVAFLASLMLISTLCPLQQAAAVAAGAATGCVTDCATASSADCVTDCATAAAVEQSPLAGMDEGILAVALGIAILGAAVFLMVWYAHRISQDAADDRGEEGPEESHVSLLDPEKSKAPNRESACRREGRSQRQ
jgi:hypothetical protein